jgi:hypothetical protein
MTTKRFTPKRFKRSSDAQLDPEELGAIWTALGAHHCRVKPACPPYSPPETFARPC